MLATKPDRFTAILVPPEVMTLYTSAEEPLPMTSSLMMSLPRHVSAKARELGVGICCLIVDARAYPL